MMSLDFDEIDNHDEKYMSIKNEIDQERLQKMEIKQIKMMEGQ